MPTPLRVVFLGSDPIALPLLNWLATEARTQADVIAVFTQPDRAVGRGQQVVANGIKLWAQERALPVFQPEKLTDEVRSQLAALNADVALVMAYGHILRDAFISTPRFGTLNLHASVLPKFRGASPIQTAISAGERETGVTLMRIVRKLDAGPVADLERVSIARRDTALEIEAKLAAACVPLLQRALAPLAAETLVFQAQDEATATYCRRLKKEDGVLDFNASAASVSARVNGLYPWPGCTIPVAGQLIKVGLADFSEGAAGSEAAGTVLPHEGDSVRVVARGGVVHLLKLQRPGGRLLAAPEFLRGFPIEPGTVLASVPMPDLVAPQPFKY